MVSSDSIRSSTLSAYANKASSGLINLALEPTAKSRFGDGVRFGRLGAALSLKQVASLISMQLQKVKTTPLTRRF